MFKAASATGYLIGSGEETALADRIQAAEPASVPFAPWLQRWRISRQESARNLFRRLEWMVFSAASGVSGACRDIGLVRRSRSCGCPHASAGHVRTS